MSKLKITFQLDIIKYIIKNDVSEIKLRNMTMFFKDHDKITNIHVSCF